MLNKTQNSLVEAIKGQVNSTPEKESLIFLYSNGTTENITYTQLDSDATRYADALYNLGIKAGDLAILALDHSYDLVSAFLGAIYLGAVPSIFPYFNSNTTHEVYRDRLQKLVVATQAGAVITTSEFRDDLAQLMTETHCQVIDIHHIPANISDRAGQASPNKADSTDTAYVQFSSGTTGSPKGTVLSHQAVLNQIESLAAFFPFTKADVGVGWLPLYHDMGLVLQLLMPLLTGALSVLISPFHWVRRPRILFEAIDRYKGTFNCMPNFAFKHAVRGTRPGDLSGLDLSSWRILISGSELIQQETLVEFAEYFSPYGFSSKALMAGYGMAEIVLLATKTPLGDLPDVDWVSIHHLQTLKQAVPVSPETEGATAIVSCGFPKPGTEIDIIDENGNRLTDRQVGEIIIRTSSLFTGYYGRSDLTTQAIRDGWFYSGDLGYMIDGQLYFCDRKKDLIIVGGQNVFPDYIENCAKTILGNFAGQTVAFGLQDKRFGTEAPIVVCELRRHLDEIEHDRMVHQIRREVLQQLDISLADVRFVNRNWVIKTTSGKIARSANKQKYIDAGYAAELVEYQPVPTSIPQQSDQGNPDALTHADIEEKLTAIWAEVLNLKQVNIGDTFLELGGNSLLAAQIIFRVLDVFRVEIPQSILFETDSVVKMAAEIARQKGEQETVAGLPPVEPSPHKRHLPFPLNDIQQAYWLGRSEVFELGQVATHGYLETESTDLDLEQLARSWQKLIERHPMLRAVVLPTGEQQVVEQPPPYQIELLDLQGAEPETVTAHLKSIRQRMSHQVLPADRWPLFEIRVTRYNHRFRLHISFDLLMTDFGSWQLLFHEWTQLYQNPDLFLPSLDLSFRDYVLAEKALEDSDLYRQSQKYWLDRLDTLPPAPDFPLVRDPGSIQPRFKGRSSQLEPEAWQRLKQKATQAGLTPSGVLLAAFAEILTVWGKSPRFIVNLTLSNRLPIHPQVNEIAGDFTTLIPLEVDNSIPASTFGERAQRTQQQLWQDLDYRYFSGVRVSRELTRRHNVVGKAIMPVVFTSALALPQQGYEGTLSPFGETVFRISQTPQVWLDHQVYEQNGTLCFSWDAVEELFPTGLLDDMFDAYCVFLKRLATDETAWTETSWSLVPPGQLAQRTAVNAITAPISDEMLHTLFIAQVEARADETAVISSQRTLTYRELYEQAIQVGHWLREAGATPNSLVAVVMEKGWEQVVAVLGTLMAGAAYLPIDPDLPVERQHYLLEQGEVKLGLTQAKFYERLTWPESIQCLEVDTAELAFRGPLDPVQTPADLAYVIYTSGSTGLPKGVIIDHRGAVNTVLDINRRFGVTHTDRVLALSALNFDLSVYDIFGLLAAGGAIVMPEADRRRDPSHWTELMEKHQVTLWDTVPALMQMLVEYQTGRPLNAPLRLVMMSGDWIPLDLPDRIKTLRNDVQVMSLGGATEASIWSIFYPIGTVDPSWKSIPYGKPLTNQTFHVLNELLEPCPIWVPGQLYIGGIGLALGYWHDDEKTRASFITHPASGERLYKTGDLGRYLPDGNIEFLGREDFQVKIRGHRIELGEIEANLLRFPAIRETVVEAIGEPRGDKQLVAYLVPESGTIQEPGNGQSIDQAAYGLEEMKGILTDPVDRLEFKLKQTAICPLDSQRPSIEFPQPSLDETAYIARQSYRQFLPEPVPFEKFGQWLACLLPQVFPNTVLPKYRYGSAGSLYPVQTYLYVKPGRVADVEGGTYYYHPLAHRLVLLSAEARIELQAHGGANRGIFEQSAFSLFLVGELKAIEPMYGVMSRDFCLLEAGYMSQLLMEEAPTHEIGLCPIGGLDFEPIRSYFELSDSQELLHSFLGGAISPVQMKALSQQEAAPHLPELEREIREYLTQRLPEYMVPDFFVPLETLPLTPNGKVDRKALPLPDVTMASEPAVAPGNEVEQRLVSIIREVLELEQISVTSNFFNVGATSLHIIRIHNKLQEVFGQEVSVTDIFRHATVRSLAQYMSQTEQLPTVAPQQGQKQDDVRIEQLAGGTDLLISGQTIPNEIESISRDRDIPLSRVQQRLWLYSQQNPDDRYYHVFVGLRLTGKLDATVLKQCIDEISDRHEIMRTTFPMVNGAPVQAIAPPSQIDVPIRDWPRLSEEEQSDAIARCVQDERERVFDLDHGPLWRVTLMRLGEEEHILLLCAHHIIMDAWSAGIFIEELTALYEAFASDLPSPLPPLPIQYADFAHWQHHPLIQETLEAKRNYGKQWLTEEPPLFELHSDRPRPDAETFRSAMVEYQINPDLTRQLEELSQQTDTTLYTIMLSAFGILLHRYSDCEELVVASPFANRDHQTRSLIGCFFNNLMLRIDLRGNPSFRELLTRVQQVTLAAIANQDVPFEQWVQELQPERDLKHNPLFRVIINLLPDVSNDRQLPGLTVAPLPIYRDVMRLDLFLVIEEKMSPTGAFLQGVWLYKTDLFEADTIVQMSGNFQHLLASIVANPEQPVAEWAL